MSGKFDRFCHVVAFSKPGRWLSGIVIGSGCIPLGGLVYGLCGPRITGLHRLAATILAGSVPLVSLAYVILLFQAGDNWQYEEARALAGEEVIAELQAKITALAESNDATGEGGCAECSVNYQLGIRDALTAVGQVKEELPNLTPSQSGRHLKLIQSDPAT